MEPERGSRPRQEPTCSQTFDACSMHLVDPGIFADARLTGPAHWEMNPASPRVLCPVSPQHRASLRSGIRAGTRPGGVKNVDLKVTWPP